MAWLVSELADLLVYCGFTLHSSGTSRGQCHKTAQIWPTLGTESANSFHFPVAFFGLTPHPCRSLASLAETLSPGGIK
jgi:hypothetical protein